MSLLFDRARGVSAVDLARQAGIRLRRNGDREWACCPFHREKTASCCFYPDGRWYCFGCHAGGDGIAFYAQLHGIGLRQAARELARETALPRRAWKPPRREAFLDSVDAQGYTWDRLCKIRNNAVQAMDMEKPDTDAFWTALKAKALAEDRLDDMQEEEAWRTYLRNSTIRQ